MIQGHCICGFVRYTADGPPSQETNCHCSVCRRVSGAPYVAWTTLPVASFRFLSDTPSRFRSSDHATRTFCPRCGTPLTFRSDHFPDEIDMAIYSLDRPELLLPKDHNHTSAKLPWVVPGDHLPAFPESRP